MSEQQPDALRLDDKHCAYRCPHYQGGSVTSICNLYGEHLNYSNAGKPMLLPQCVRTELSRLQAENEALRDSVAAKADRIDRLGEMVERLQAGGQGVEPIGEAGTMPGTSGFTMACFHADKVPVGTKLYLHPPAAPASLTDDEIVWLISPVSNNSASHDIEFARRVIDAMQKPKS